MVGEQRGREQGATAVARRLRVDTSAHGKLSQSAAVVTAVVGDVMGSLCRRKGDTTECNVLLVAFIRPTDLRTSARLAAAVRAAVPVIAGEVASVADVSLALLVVLMAVELPAIRCMEADSALIDRVWAARVNGFTTGPCGLAVTVHRVASLRAVKDRGLGAVAEAEAGDDWQSLQVRARRSSAVSVESAPVIAELSADEIGNVVVVPHPVPTDSPPALNRGVEDLNPSLRIGAQPSVL